MIDKKLKKVISEDAQQWQGIQVNPYGILNREECFTEALRDYCQFVNRKMITVF